jgi:hypothetical protein
MSKIYPCPSSQYKSVWKYRFYGDIAMLVFGFSVQQAIDCGSMPISTWGDKASVSKFRHRWKDLHPQYKREVMLDVWLQIFKHPRYRGFALSKRRYLHAVVGRDAIEKALMPDVERGLFSMHDIMEVLAP